MPTAMVTLNGRITLPPQVLRNLELKTGDNVEFVEVEKGRFAISRPNNVTPDSNFRRRRTSEAPLEN